MTTLFYHRVLNLQNIFLLFLTFLDICSAQQFSEEKYGNIAQSPLDL